MSWRLATCLDVLIEQVDELHPDRPTGADGTIGDAAHATRLSDHNPRKAARGAQDQRAVVCGWDCTAAPFVDDLAEQLRAMGAAGDGRVKYLIWQQRITSAAHGWEWEPYTGADPHTGHLHLSVSSNPAQYDRHDPWPIGPGTAREDDIDVTRDELREVLQDELAKVHGAEKQGKDADPTHVSLLDVLRATQHLASKVDALASKVDQL